MILPCKHTENKPLVGVRQGCGKIRKTTLAGESAEGDNPLPEREVSSLRPSFLPPQAAKREFATAQGCP